MVHDNKSIQYIISQNSLDICNRGLVSRNSLCCVQIFLWHKQIKYVPQNLLNLIFYYIYSTIKQLPKFVNWQVHSINYYTFSWKKIDAVI